MDTENLIGRVQKIETHLFGAPNPVSSNTAYDERPGSNTAYDERPKVAQGWEAGASQTGQAPQGSWGAGCPAGQQPMSGMEMHHVEQDTQKAVREAFENFMSMPTSANWNLVQVYSVAYQNNWMQGRKRIV